MTILYIHGFNSAASTKMNFLSDEKNTVVSESLSSVPERAAAQITAMIEKYKDSPLLLCGTSLGGFYALHFAEKYKLPAVLINPSLRANENLKKRIGQQINHKTGEQYFFKKEYLQTLAMMRCDLTKLKSRYLVFVAKHDDVINHDGIEQHFSEVIRDEKATHRFSNISDYEKEIRAFADLAFTE